MRLGDCFVRPEFPYEFSSEQIQNLSPYNEILGELSETLDWLRYSILHKHEQEYRPILEDLHRQLAELESKLLKNSKL